MTNARTSLSLTGFYYDGQSSQRHACTLHVAEGGLVQLDGIRHGLMPFADLDIPPRIGNTARTLGLPGGGFFETADNQALDALIKNHRPRGRGLSLHQMEHKLRYILPLLAFCVLVVYLTVTQGIPYASERVAYQLSADWSEELGESVLDRLDEFYFSPTRTAKPEQSRYRQLLEDYLPAGSDFEYTLYFRDGDLIGANAFALPDGSVVVTDELLALADRDEEVLAVLLHEIGHVERRHSLRALLESSGVAILFTLMTGDAEFVHDFVVALPPLLMQAKFSRDHEWEADTYALDRMQAAGLDPIHFSTMMAKLTSQAEPATNADDKDGEPEADDHEGAAERSAGSRMLDYLSSHPPSEERVERFRQASEAFTVPAE